MASRVAEALAAVAKDERPEWILPEALPEENSTRIIRARALLVCLDRLVVCTIHAFCRRILSRNPMEAGLHPAFTVDADSETLEAIVREVIERWLRVTLAGTPPDELLELAERGIGPAEIAGAVKELASAGAPPEALRADPLEPARLAALARRLADVLRAVAEIAVPRFAGSKKARNAALIADVLPGLAERVAAAPSLAELQRALESDLPEKLREHLGKWGKANYNKTEEEALGDAGVELALSARTLRAAVEHALGIDAVLLRAVRTVVAPLVEEVRQTMRRRGAETFDALLRDTRDLLLRRPEVVARERGAISQLLVDEFQDTDPLQCEIVRLLALEGAPDERPGLFLVGDPKQSIFGWRNADLAAYDAFRSLIAERGDVLGLSVNFRSAPPILAEVERCVRPVMKAETGVQPEFQSLQPSEARAASSGFAQGRWAPVEFWVSWPRPDDPASKVRVGEATRVEAAALARDIRALHDEAGAAWDEFGVLLRSAGDLDVYLQSLRDADVPYVVERDRSYYRRREIIDAAALVRTVLDPADHLALVTVLRSAIVGVPDAALMPLWSRGLPALLTELRGTDGPRLAAVAETAREVAASPPAGVPGLERVRGWENNLIAFAGNLGALRESFERDTAVEFLERLRTSTLLEATEAARPLGRFRVANLERFFRRLLGTVDETGADVQGVLRALRTAVTEQREGEEARPGAGGEDAVRILTIHKAKGLDFRHVYLLQTHHGSRADTKSETRVEEVGGAFEYTVLGATTPGWDALAQHRAQTTEAELVRTLYVAMTRAKDRLVVSGAWPRGNGRASAGTHLRLLGKREPSPPDLDAVAGGLVAVSGACADECGIRWVFPALVQGGTPPPRLEAPPLPSRAGVNGDREKIAARQERAIERMARPFSSPASAEAHRSLLEELGEERETSRTARTERSAAAAAGSAVHRVLERLDLGADLADELARGAERLPRDLEGLVDPERVPAALARASDLLERLRTGPLMDRLQAIARGVVARELPVLLLPGEGQGAPVGFVSGTIDLVYRDPNTGELVIADYKTDEVAAETKLQEHAGAYAAQGAVYRRALREALGLSEEPRFELWFIHLGVVLSIPPQPSR
jgi:ATP-dependent helicase/nuclease subunit A